MSPERIAPQRFGFEDGRPTIPSDCYALGMVIYETISGNLPFHKDPDLIVFMKVVEGERPPRGDKFTRTLWRMLEWCWAPKSTDRPSIEDVLQCLEIASNSSEPSSPTMNEGTDEEDGDWVSATSSPGGDTPTTYDRVQFPQIHSGTHDRHTGDDGSLISRSNSAQESGLFSRTDAGLWPKRSGWH